MNINADDIKENDVYAIKDKEMFVVIGGKAEHPIEGLMQLCGYSKYKELPVPLFAKDIEFYFESVNEIIALIESGEWVKCVNVKEELKTI